MDDRQHEGAAIDDDLLAAKPGTHEGGFLGRPAIEPVEDIGNDCDHDRKSSAALAAIAVAGRASPAARIKEHAEDHFGEERDHACDDHGDHQHAHVAVADVGQLVTQHRLELGIVERLDEPTRHRHGILLLVHAARKGIERGRLDDLELRHGDAARDAEIFEQVIEPRLFLPRHLAPAGHQVDERLVESVRNKDPERSADSRKWCGFHGVDPGALQQPLQRGIVAHRLSRERRGEHHDVDEEEQADQQQDRAPPVRLDMCVEAVGCCHARCSDQVPPPKRGRIVEGS